MATSSSNPSDFDIDIDAPAVIEWLAEKHVQRLCHPDPHRDDIVFEARFTQQDSPAASFKLRIPVYLKGVKKPTYIIVIIDPESIISFDFKKFAEAPPPVHEKLNYSVTSLNFQLFRSVDIVVPASATSDSELLMPQRPSSGKILDKLRSSPRLGPSLYTSQTKRFPRLALKPSVGLSSLRPHYTHYTPRDISRPSMGPATRMEAPENSSTHLRLVSVCCHRTKKRTRLPARKNQCPRPAELIVNLPHSRTRWYGFVG